MAFIRDQFAESFASATTMQVSSLPVHKAGDLLIILCANRTGGATVSATGWTYSTDMSAGSNNSVKLMMLFRTATTDDEAPPLIALNSAAGTLSVACFSIGDHDGFDNVGKANLTMVDSGTVTSGGATSFNNSLIIYAVARQVSTSNTPNISQSTQADFLNLQSSNSVLMLTMCDTQLIAGAMTPPTVYSALASQAGQCGWVSIKNSVGGSLHVHKKSVATPMMLPLWGYPLTHPLNTGLATLQALSGIAASINGLATSTVAPTDVAAGGGGTSRSFTTDIANVWGGGAMVLTTPIDITGKILAFAWSVSSTGSGYSAARPQCMLLADNSGNWVAIPLITRGAATANNFVAAIYTPESVTPFDGSGVVDFTDIKKFGLCYARTNSTASIQIQCTPPLLHDPANPLTFVGGGLNNPVNGINIQKVANSMNVPTQLLSTAGIGQAIYPIPLRIGNTSFPTFFDARTASWEQPRSQVLSARIFGYDVDPDLNGITIDASSADTILMSQGIFASGRQAKFSIDPSSSILADYDFSASIFKNMTFSFLDGMTIDSCTFSECPEIDGQAATFNNVTFDNPNISGTNGALKLKNGGNATSCAFNMVDASDYAIVLTQAGDYDLTGTTYTNCTTPIKVTALTGTVTITLAVTDTTPSFSTDGATVVFDQPTDNQKVILNGGVANSRIQLYDLTSNTELAQQIVTTFPFTWEDPNPYVADRQIRLRVSYQNGTTAKKFIDQIIGVATELEPTINFLINQEDDTVYIANAINGSLVTDIMIDDTNLLVEVDTGTVSYAQIYAYEVYWLYTAAGIIDEGKYINAIDPANYIFQNIKIKNVTSPTVPLTITGGWGRDSVTNQTIDIIDTAGGTVFAAPDLVIAFATGSGLSPSEQATLNQIAEDVNKKSLQVGNLIVKI